MFVMTDDCDAERNAVAQVCVCSQNKIIVCNVMKHFLLAILIALA